MKHKAVAGLAALTIALAGIVAASAHDWGSWGGMQGRGYYMMGPSQTGPGYMHEDMERVFEAGKYSDLQALRDKYQMPVMPWVTNQEDFDKAKGVFEARESFNRTGQQYYRNGCPMW